MIADVLWVPQLVGLSLNIMVKKIGHGAKVSRVALRGVLCREGRVETRMPLTARAAVCPVYKAFLRVDLILTN